MHILIGTLWGIAAQIITFLQLQGQMKYSFLKNNLWFGALMGIPISLMFMQSVKHFVLAYDGQIWPSRVIGFSIGIVVFTSMATLLFKEPLTLKTILCLILSFGIIFIQVYMK